MAHDDQAPDVSPVGDTYYAFYAVSQIGFQGSQIGVATSKSLHVGTWTDLGSMNIPQSSEYNLIDPNLFQENGALYLSFGSYWQDIFQAKLSSPPLPTSTKSAPINLAFNSTNGAGSTAHDIIEGSFQFKFDNKYYLFFSSGACCNAPPNLAPKGDEYHVEVSVHAALAWASRLIAAGLPRRRHRGPVLGRFREQLSDAERWHARAGLA